MNPVFDEPKRITPPSSPILRPRLITDSPRSSRGSPVSPLPGKHSKFPLSMLSKGDDVSESSNVQQSVQSTSAQYFHQDMQNNGKWGTISKRELTCVVISLMLLTAAVSGVLVAVVRRGASVDTNVAATTVWTSVDKYDLILKALQNSTETKAIASFLPTTAEDLDQVKEDQSNNDNDIDIDVTTFLLAAKWATEEDRYEVSTPESVLSRFALAAIYYANGGENWTDSFQWLSDTSECNWQGITCTIGTREIQQVGLSRNNLVGCVSPAFALLTSVRVISLDGNSLTGDIPGEVFGSLPSLAILYLQENKFTGDIPASLRSNGKLYTLYVQGNNLTGSWPEEFCRICDEQNVCKTPFTEFGLDCHVNPCPEDCCSINNCF